MRLLEFASADDLLKLWQIVSQSVFAAIEKEGREAEEAQRLEASKPKKNRAVRSPSRSVSAVKAVRPKAMNPKVAKTRAIAVKPSSANMPLQTMVQEPFQQPMQTHLTKMPKSPFSTQRNMADEKLPIEKNHFNIYKKND